MKKFATLLFIFLCVSFKITTATSAFVGNVFKEGVYKPSDFNISLNNLYDIQNISSNGSVFVAIFDEHQVVIQTITLGPRSLKYNLVPLEPTYKIMIIGNGDVFIG